MDKEVNDFKILSTQNSNIVLRYSVTQASLSSGAIVNRSRTWVIYVGGPTEGVATLIVDTSEAGDYKMNLNYRNSGTFKLDVNRVINRQNYTTSSNSGYIELDIKLNKGRNELKFYGVTYGYAPYLGGFTLTKKAEPVTPVAPTLEYSLTQAVLASGAVLSSYREYVLYIGGRSRGTATININVESSGEYSIELQYVNTGAFKLDVNGRDTGELYRATSSSPGLITLKVNLNAGNNTFKFYGITSEYAPYLGKFTLKNSTKPTGISTKLKYNLTQGAIESGARIYVAIEMVTYIGGYSQGVCTVTVNVKEAGEYNMNLRYCNASKSFKIDVNGVYTGKDYTSPNQSNGYMDIKINLRVGANTLKFYNKTRDFAPYLGEFTLTKVGNIIIPDPVTIPTTIYNLKDGLLEKGARINKSRDMVTDLGGVNEGKATINVNVPEEGKYSIEIEFRNGLRPVTLDVNGVNVKSRIIFPAKITGKYVITGVLLKKGENTLKFYGVTKRVAPSLGRFNLRIDKKQTATVLPSPVQFSVTSGVLGGGAKLNSLKDLVVSLGGTNNGFSTVTVNVRESGQYNISLDCRYGGRPLNLDVNGRNTGKEYKTPTGSVGVFTTVINLNNGRNTIKFYGNGTDKASDLGSFQLEKVADLVVLPPGTYDCINGVFENNVSINNATNFVENVGGIQNGSVTVTVNVGRGGNYNVDLEYLSHNREGILNVDINSVNVGIYNMSRTLGNTLLDVLSFNFLIGLNAGDNTIKFYGDGVNPAPLLGKFILNFVPPQPQPLPVPRLPSYEFRNLNGLNYVDLISVLKSIRWSDIPGLFTFSSDSYSFFNDRNRFQAIIDALGESGRRFNSNNEEGIDTLVEVLRAGYYLGFYNSQLGHLDTLQAKDRCLPAIKNVINNRNFRLGTETQDRVVESMGRLVGNASLDLEILNAFISILNSFGRNIVSYSNEYYKNNAVFKILRESQYFLNYAAYRNNNDITNHPYYDRIDAFLTAIQNLTRLAVRASDESTANNCIFVLGQLSVLKSNKSDIHRTLTDCTNIYPQLSSQYFEAIKALENNFNSTFADGRPIDNASIIAQGKRRYLPNIYNFDNGRFVIRTGGSVTEEKVKRLYWAAKEVRAQFIRMVGDDNPLERGNADDTLTTIVYNSPAEYTMNFRLYGYDTDNGGLYIESIGTFFTYERTPRESVFSLEELFRHEYTHYLQGRYLVPGLWGRGSFYSNNVEKLTWYDEGNAEFFAGSTRTEGVKPRQSIINYLRGRSLPHIGSVLRSRYGESNFYNTSCAVFLYFYNNDLGKFRTINRYIRTTDVNSYDYYINLLSNDRDLNNRYNQVTNDYITNINRLNVPLVSDDYLVRHQRRSQQEIQRDIQSQINLRNVRVSTVNSQFFTTIIVKGNYNAGRSIDEVSDWQTMNRRLNEALINLSRLQWSGYKTFTAYFTNYRVDSSRTVTFDITFHGILNTI